MELCGEPDIFIGRRSNKFRRYSGLLEQYVIPKDNKEVRHTSRRRITINSFKLKNKNVSFNDVTSYEDNERGKATLKIESNETPRSIRYENGSSASEKKICKTNTRNKRRSRRHSFNLDCTFIEDEEGKQSSKLDQQKLPHSGRYSLRSSFGIADPRLVKNDELVTPRRIRYENESLAAGEKQVCKTYTRYKRRGRRDFFGLSTFIEDEEEKQPAKLDQQKLPHTGRYSLRSSFGIADPGLEKNYDFVTLRKIDQQPGALPEKHKRSVAAYKENINSTLEDEKKYSPCQVNARNEKGIEQRKYFSSNCKFTEDTEENQSFEFHQQQKSPHTDGRYSLRSSSGGCEYSWKRNTDFVAIRKVKGVLGTFPIQYENIEEVQDDTNKKNHELQCAKRAKGNDKNTNGSVQVTEELNEEKNGRRKSCGCNYNLLKENNSPELKDYKFEKKKRFYERKPVDMNRTFIEDTDEKQVSEFQSNQQLFNSSKYYSLRSSLGAFENNLMKNEDLAKINEESGFLQNEPTETVGLVENNHEILLELHFDKTLQTKSDEFHNNIVLPVIQESDSGIFSSDRSNRFIEETDKTLTQSCVFDKGSFSSYVDPFDNIINNEKVFVIDRETNECNCMFHSHNAKKLNDKDKEDEVSLPTQNNKPRKFECCILPLNSNTSTNINEDNFSTADMKERNKPEIIFEEANFSKSCPLENWIMSHLHVDSRQQFYKICESLKTDRRKPPNLNRSFIQFISQEKNISDTANIESIDQTFSESSSKGGGRKKDDESGKQKKSNQTKTINKCSNLETIFENPDNKLMSSRRFKRSINFENFSSAARVRRRKLKAKKINSFQSRDIVDTSKLDAILDELSLSD